MVLPEPHITIIIQENTTEPFQYKAQEIQSLLATHGDAEDILDGEHANKETIEDFDELKKLGPHPFLERQMRKLAPLRWLHLKLQLARDPDCWFQLVLRADTVYVKGFSNRPNAGAQACYEISEEQKEKGKATRNRPLLFPQEYNAVHVPWDLKYYQMLGSVRDDEDTIFKTLREMLDDPTFMTKATEFFSFLDPTVVDPGVAKRMLAGVTFKLCEFVRMRVTLDTPNLLDKVWNWGDICIELRRWKKNHYDCKCWNEIKSTGTKTPRDGLELVSLVLNRSHGAILYAENLKALAVKREKQQKDSNDSHHTKKHGKGSSAASGASTNKGGGCSDSNVPFGRCRIQLLRVCANFEIDDINVYDWHRGQKIYMNAYGCVGQESKSVHTMQDRSLVLCGPCRPIGAYGYLGMEIFPTAQESEPIIGLWDVSDYVDAEATPYTEAVYGRSNQRVSITYLHIPNAVEAKVKVLLYFGEICEISGYIKATTTCYENSYLELFMKENEKLCVPSGEWTTVPLLVDVLCLPYQSDVELKIDVGLNIAQPSGRPRRLTRALRFTSKYGKEEIEFGGNKRMAVIVTMHPDPLGLAVTG